MMHLISIKKVSNKQFLMATCLSTSTAFFNAQSVRQAADHHQFPLVATWAGSQWDTQQTSGHMGQSPNTAQTDGTECREYGP